MPEEQRCPTCRGHRGLAKMLYDDIDNPRECTDDFHRSEAPAEVIEFPGPHGEDKKSAETPAEAVPTPQVTISKSVCPHCGSEDKISGRLTVLGPFQVMIVSCGNQDCRKILGAFQALQLQMVQPPTGITH